MFIEHHLTNALWKSKWSISMVSNDIFIRVGTLSVFSLAQSFVLIKFCLLTPLSQSTEETGIVSSRKLPMKNHFSMMAKIFFSLILTFYDR